PRHLVVRLQAALEDMLERNRLGWGQVEGVLCLDPGGHPRTLAKLIEVWARRRLDFSLAPETAAAPPAESIAEEVVEPVLDAGDLFPVAEPAAEPPAAPAVPAAEPEEGWEAPG